MSSCLDYSAYMGLVCERHLSGGKPVCIAHSLVFVSVICFAGGRHIMDLSKNSFTLLECIHVLLSIWYSNHLACVIANSSLI